MAWNKYSLQFPPLHALVAKYLKYEPPAKEDAKVLTTEEHAARLLGQLGFNA